MGELLASEKSGERRGDNASEDVYWKIGLGLADVSAAREKLMKRGAAVSEPQQFMDIGFLCHLRDPAGYSIELLQHQFEANFSKSHADRYVSPERPLGQNAVVGQITLRIAEAAKMPDPNDLDSVGNREWLWQRDYTTLELQHRLTRGKPLSHTPPDEPGFRGFAVAVSKERFDKLRAEAVRESEDEHWGNRLHLNDPDGTEITVINEGTE